VVAPQEDRAMKLAVPRESWMTLLVAVLALLFLVQAPRIGLVAGRIPFVVLGLTLSLVGWQLAREFVAQQSRSDDTAGADTVGATRDAWRVLRAIVWIFVLLLAVVVAGIVPGVGLFCLVFLRLQADESWSFSLVFALILSASVYLVFGLLFGASLYAGLLSWP